MTSESPFEASVWAGGAMLHEGLEGQAGTVSSGIFPPREIPEEPSRSFISISGKNWPSKAAFYWTIPIIAVILRYFSGRFVVLGTNAGHLGCS